MENRIEIDQSGKQVTIFPSGTFGTRNHTEFAEIYRSRPRELCYLLDFTNVEHIDSGGIGMLLLMREFLGNRPQAIQIVHCAPQVRELLTVSKINQLVSVS